jgi:hypothetical protein
LTKFVIVFTDFTEEFLYSFDYCPRTVSAIIRTLAGEQRCLLGDGALRHKQFHMVLPVALCRRLCFYGAPLPRC